MSDPGSGETRGGPAATWRPAPRRTRHLDLNAVEQTFGHGGRTDRPDHGAVRHGPGRHAGYRTAVALGRGGESYTMSESDDLLQHEISLARLGDVGAVAGGVDAASSPSGGAGDSSGPAFRTVEAPTPSCGSNPVGTRGITVMYRGSRSAGHPGRGEADRRGVRRVDAYARPARGGTRSDGGQAAPAAPGLGLTVLPPDMSGVGGGCPGHWMPDVSPGLDVIRVPQPISRRTDGPHAEACGAAQRCDTVFSVWPGNAHHHADAGRHASPHPRPPASA